MTEHQSSPTEGYDDFLRNLKERIRSAQVADAHPNEQFVQQVVAQIHWGHNVRFLDAISHRVRVVYTGPSSTVVLMKGLDQRA